LKNYKELFEDLEKVFAELIEKNKKIPIIVEGEKDKDALIKLGIIGEIITINKGMSLIDFCDWFAQSYTDVIILTDWDRKGGFIGHTIKKNLEGRVNCDLKYREFFAKNTTIKTVEGLPHWIKTMNEKFQKI